MSNTIKQKYKGSTASSYENRRLQVGWVRGNRAVDDILRDIVNKDVNRILDIPVGTGRFFEIYKDLPVKVLGIDVSEDMLEQARKKLKNENNITLRKGDIFQLDLDDFNPDIIVCVRFLNLVELEDLKKAMSRLLEFDPKYMIITLWTYSLNKCDNVRELALFVGAQIFKKIKLGKPNVKKYDEDDLIEIFDEVGVAIKQKELIQKNPNGTKKHVYLLTIACYTLHFDSNREKIAYRELSKEG